MADDAKTDDQPQAEDDKKEETTEAPAEETKAEEKPAEEKKEEPKADDTADSKEYSKEVSDIVAKVEKMTVLEVADLVSAIEDKFGVSAAPVAVAGAAPAAGGDAAGGDEGGKSEFTIHLVAAGEKKIEAIKAVREITQLGLKEAKDLVDGAPKDVKENVPADEANEAKSKLEAAGATVELK
jgi:large subunit ribosomal protein L7/L12